MPASRASGASPANVCVKQRTIPMKCNLRACICRDYFRQMRENYISDPNMQCLSKRIFVGAFLLMRAAQAGEDPLQGFGLDPSIHNRLKSTVESRDYAAAEKLLVDESERSPQSQPVLLALANIFFLDGKHLDSAVALKKAQKLGPLDERHQMLLALSYMTIGRLNWAQPEFEKLARSNQSNAVYPYWLARIAYRKMDIPSALAHAKRAVELD